MKFKSITAPSVEHDAPNMITELLFLNKEHKIIDHPWRGSHRLWWSKTVSAIKKLMRDHNISEDQLAFYVFKCSPTEISSEEFAKAAVVAKKLFKKYNLNELVEHYRSHYKISDDFIVLKIKESKQPKSLLEFLKELADGEK